MSIKKNHPPAQSQGPLNEEELEFYGGLIDTFIDAACAHNIGVNSLDLGTLPEGKKLLGLRPEQGVRMMLFCFADMKNYRRKLQEMARESSYEYFPRVAEMPKDYARYTVEMLIVRQLLNRK